PCPPRSAPPSPVAGRDAASSSNERSPDMKFSTVGVVGAGNIGTGVITDLVLHGLNAVVVDISEAALRRAHADVLKNIRVAPMFSKTLPRVSPEEAMQRMIFSRNLKD